MASPVGSSHTPKTSSRRSCKSQGNASLISIEASFLMVALSSVPNTSTDMKEVSKASGEVSLRVLGGPSSLIRLCLQLTNLLRVNIKVEIT